MIRNLLLGSLALVVLASPVAAADATLLGAFENWNAFASGDGATKTCYAMSKPRAVEPRGAKRTDVFLMVSDWPGRRVKSELEIVPGYQYKLTTPVTLGIGGDRFTFFARNNGAVGTAWLQNLADGNSLIDAMRGGVSAVAIGTSSRGTRSVDTYSLAGFNDAVAKIHAACNM